MRHLKLKTSRARQAVIPWIQKAFKRTYRDTPAVNIPNTGLADSQNFLPFDARAMGRHGCRAVNAAGTYLPNIAGREDYEATKSGSAITKTVGEDFTTADINHFFVWPDGTADLIIAWVSSTEVTADNTIVRGPATSGSPGAVRGRINSEYFSKKNKIAFLHMGTKVYHSNNVLLNWVEAPNISGDTLPNTKSTFNEYRGKIYLSTDSGHYLIDTDTQGGSEFYVVKTNSATISNVISTETQKTSDAMCRRYLYSYVRMTGSYFNDRTNSANAILKESAANKVDGTTNIDYAVQCFRSVIQTDPDDSTNLIPYNDGGLFTRIQGGLVTAALEEFLPFTNGRFIGRFQVGTSLVDREIAVNLSEVTSFEQIAQILQAAIRSSYPDATGLPEVKFVNNKPDPIFTLNGGPFNGSHCMPFTFRAKGSVTTTGGLVDTTLNQFITRGVKVGDVVTNLVTGDQTTVTFVQSASTCDTADSIFTVAGQAYTVEPASDISALLKLREDEADSTIYNSDAQHDVLADHTLGAGETQWTHIAYYGTPNLITQPESSNVYAWLFDIPLVKALNGSLATTGIVTLTDGTISLQDVGRSIIFRTGERHAIGEYISPTSFLIARNTTIGRNDTVTASALRDTDKSPFVPAMVGHNVINTVTGAVTTVSAYVSTSQLTLTDNIFTKEFHRYEIYDDSTAIAAGPIGVNTNAVYEMDSSSQIVTVLNGDTPFTAADVGKALFWQDGTISHIIEFISTSSVKVAEGQTKTSQAAVILEPNNQGTTLTGTTDTAGIGGIGDITAAPFVEYGSKPGMVITNTTNPDTANVTDVNPDGTKMLLDKLIFESPAEGYSMPIPDSFNDTITDDVLINRISDWPLRTRFFDPLPDARFAAIQTGFWYVANLNGAEVYYSQMSQLLEYLGGHYYAPYQNVPVKDAIRSLQEFPEQVVIYCSRSTYRINTNVPNIVTIPEVGESVALISGIALADADLGISDHGSIQELEQGQQIVITTEPGVRIFDGFNFGENLAVDREGRPMFLKDLEALHKSYASAYDPVMGYIFWADTRAAFGAGRSLDNIFFTKCFRVGVMQEQARGWGEITGSDWPFMYPSVSMLKMVDSFDTELLVLFDERDSTAYALDKTVFTDKADSAGAGGTEIATLVKFKEHKGKRESYRIKHLISHFYVRPQFETNQNASGHDVRGMRNAQAFTVKAYEDGKLVAQAEVFDVPFNGEIAFDNKIIGNRIQLELSTLASEYQLVQHDTDYTEKDTRAVPSLRNTTWHDYQRMLADVMFWVGRDVDDNTINRATGNRPASHSSTPQLGPGNSLTGAMRLPAGVDNVYTDTISLLSSRDFTVSFWVTLAQSGTNPVVTVGSGSTGLVVAYSSIPANGSSSTTIRLTIGGVEYTATFDGFYIPTANTEAEGFHYVRVSRRTNSHFAQINKLAEKSMSSSSAGFNGAVTINADNAAITDLADVRIFNGGATQAISDYYYDDVINKTIMHSNIGGGKVLSYAGEDVGGS